MRNKIDPMFVNKTPRETDNSSVSHHYMPVRISPLVIIEIKCKTHPLCTQQQIKLHNSCAAQI